MFFVWLYPNGTTANSTGIIHREVCASTIYRPLHRPIEITQWNQIYPKVYLFKGFGWRCCGCCPIIVAGDDSYSIALTKHKLHMGDRIARLWTWFQLKKMHRFDSLFARWFPPIVFRFNFSSKQPRVPARSVAPIIKQTYASRPSPPSECRQARRFYCSWSPRGHDIVVLV